MDEIERRFHEDKPALAIYNLQDCELVTRIFHKTEIMPFLLERATVNGLPAPQGSHKHVGGGRMVESSKKVKPWRQDVKAAAEALGNTPTVAKSSYIDPRVFTRYRRGQVLDVTVSPESAIRTLLLG